MLGRFEERVLWEIVHAGGETTTTELQIALIAKFKVGTPGAIYTTLHRLIDKQFVSFKKGEPLKERGGKARNKYKITLRGRGELLALQRAAAELGSPSDLALPKHGARA